MRTLRGRLLLGTAVGTALILSTFSMVVYGVVRSSLVQAFDDGLTDGARALITLVEQEENEVQFDEEANSIPEFKPSDHAEYFQLWSGETVVARSASLGQSHLERIRPDADEPHYHQMDLPDGRPGRAMQLTFLPRQESPGKNEQARPVTLVVARDTIRLDRTLTRLRLLLVGLCFAAILSSVGILAWFVRRGLAPVAHLAGQIAQVGESDLASRIAAENVPGELMPIVQRLNELLVRLESAFNRERVFTADVAHELRTPLAGLHTMLEVSASKLREATEYRRTLAESLAVAQQMQQMVTNLLHLTRADARQWPITREAVDLVGLVRECFKPLAAACEERRLHVDWRIPPSLILHTDQTMLQLVFANVLDNAATHCDPGGQITVQLNRETTGQVTLSVTNTGSQVPADQVEHVFDRFWRGDASRSAVGQHCGLGLPLCRKLITLLGGVITAESEFGGNFSVTIKWTAPAIGAADDVQSMT